MSSENTKKTILDKIIDLFGIEKGGTAVSDLAENPKKSYEILFEVSPEAILILDRNGKALLANKRLTEWLGFNQKEIIGQTVFDFPFIDEESRRKIKELHHKRISGDKLDSYEVKCQKKSGEEFFGRITASLIHDPSGKVAGEIVMISDVTADVLTKSNEKVLAEDLKTLSELAVGFVKSEAKEDMYELIGRGLARLMPNCYILVNKYNPEKDIVKTVFTEFGSKSATVSRLLGKSVGGEFILGKREREILISQSLYLVKDGIYGLTMGKVPKAFARMAEKTLQIKEVYILGFALEDKLFGNAVVAIKTGQQLREETMKAFLYQASVALQKREAETKVLQSRDELEIKVKERTAALSETARDLEKFKLAVENASDSIVITDLKGKVLYANKATEAVTGFAPEEAVGKTPTLWGCKLSNDFDQELWRTIREQKKPFIGETDHIRKNGESYVADLHIAPVVNAAGETIFYVRIERDITKAKEIDKVKTEFVSLASHQLRTPLTSINWYTEMLLNKVNSGMDKEKLIQYVKEISKASQRMVELVNALLNTSRIELGTFVINPQMIDIEKLCQGVLDELKPSIEKKKININFSFDQSIPKLKVDQNLMRIIFQNLISNAVKYTPDEGKVEVNIGYKNEQKKIILISVKDNGYGIPAHQQDQIFQKLFRADNIKSKVAEGTGLGLYIVKSIVDHSGGSISFHSKEGQGTSFFVEMPSSGMAKKEGSRPLN